jgi:hypothetical protein
MPIGNVHGWSKRRDAQKQREADYNAQEAVRAERNRMANARSDAIAANTYTNPLIIPKVKERQVLMRRVSRLAVAVVSVPWPWVRRRYRREEAADLAEVDLAEEAEAHRYPSSSRRTLHPLRTLLCCLNGRSVALKISDLESWRNLIGPRVDSLASDLARVMAMLAQLGNSRLLEEVAVWPRRQAAEHHALSNHEW